MNILQKTSCVTLSASFVTIDTVNVLSSMRVLKDIKKVGGDAYKLTVKKKKIPYIIFFIFFNSKVDWP